RTRSEMPLPGRTSVPVCRKPPALPGSRGQWPTAARRAGDGVPSGRRGRDRSLRREPTSTPVPCGREAPAPGRARMSATATRGGQVRQFDLVIRSRRAVTPTGVGPAAVAVVDGRVAAVADHAAELPCRSQTDLGEVALLPGMVDVDAAVQAPGQLLSQGYARTTRAAAAGGITTLVVAPAPAQPAITSTGTLRAHLHASASSCAVHVAFLGGITPRSGPAELADLRANGVVGFACSLSDGGGGGLAALDDVQLGKSMAEVATMDVPLVVHAEDARELGSPVGPS